MVIGDVILYPAAQRLEEGVNPVDLRLEFQAEADTATRFLSLEIDTGPIMPGTPGAGRLGAITLHLPGLAELAPRWETSVNRATKRCFGVGHRIREI